MIYIASPYSHEAGKHRHERYCLVSIAAAIIAKDMNEVPYSPIMHWHPIDNALGGDYMTHAKYIEMDKHMIDLSSELWVYQLDGYDKSKGVVAEVEYAVHKDKTVRYFKVVDGRIIHA